MKRITLAFMAFFFTAASAFAFDGALMFKALSGGNPVDQYIANATAPYQTLTFNSAAYDTGSYWNSSRNCFQIPAGVSKVQFSGQAVFLYSYLLNGVMVTNNIGLRQLLIQRSAPGSTTFAFFPGVPIHNTMAVTGTTTDIAFTSAVLPVTEGECYALQPYQDSGSSLAVSGGGGTWFAMEVIL